MTQPLDILRSVFGYEQFRSPQDEVISTLMAGEDALANQLVLLISMVCILILLAVGRLARARDGR